MPRKLFFILRFIEDISPGNRGPAIYLPISISLDEIPSDIMQILLYVAAIYRQNKQDILRLENENILKGFNTKCYYSNAYTNVCWVMLLILLYFSVFKIISL